jgi:PTH1 family peptidyl-tRNA hydrolase
MIFSKSACDWLVVGLGNPGKQYAATRHNVGFMAIDRLAERLGVNPNRAKFRGTGCLATFNGQKLYLLKPETMMNLSGLAVRQAAQFYKLPPERVLVIFDDISLDPGRLRLRASGSAGGHNGVKSIIAELQSQDFPRVKVGVGAKPHPDYDLAAWVLSTFSAQEKKVLEPALDQAADAVLDFIEHGYEHAASRFNTKK